MYKTDKVDVTVDAQVTTQERYPAVRVANDADKFLQSGYVQKMTEYFFQGAQPYYRAMQPGKFECTLKLFLLEQALSSGRIPEPDVESANQDIKELKAECQSAPDEVPFDIAQDPHGERYMLETGNGKEIALVAYPDDGMVGVDISKYMLWYSNVTSLYVYDYEVGLDWPNGVPASVAMDAQAALKIAEDSVGALAEGEDMELVRAATIAKTLKYIDDRRNAEPDCLVFYFMRSYDGIRQTCIQQADLSFSNDMNPDYRPGVGAESIRVVVDGMRIVEWSWTHPALTVGELSDHVPLMPFAQIKEIFRRQVKNCYAYYDFDEIRNIHINRVALGLMRIGEKNNPQSSLVVPVWDFIGTRSTIYRGAKDGGDDDYTFLTVNAIDGTIINKGRGY